MADFEKENQKLTQELADRDEMLASITANIPGVVYQFYARKNRDWGMYYVSERSQEIFGIGNNPRTFVENFIARLPDHDRQRFLTSIDVAVQSKTPWIYEGLFVRPDGEEIYFRGNSVPTDHGDELIFNGLLLDITDQWIAEQENEEKARILSATMANLPGAVFEFTVDESGQGQMDFVSERAEEIFGVEAQQENFFELFGNHVPEKHQDAFRRSIEQAVKTETPWYYEGPYHHPKGQMMHFHGAAIPAERRGRLVYHGILMDQTDQHRVQEELRHNQKLDSLGQLAGGVAHDFNNMLGGIMGAAELILERNKNDRETSQLSRLILETAERAGDLTWQLLAFSRKAVNVRKPQAVHDIVQRTRKILERSVDRRIRVECDLAAQHQTVMGDPGQLQASLLNLAVNARDAMPHGGTIRFETSELDLKAGQAHAGQALPAGKYVSIRVRDTGTGIPESVQARIFEPFFTTKPTGQGTGMGLAAVYGTVAEHRGSVSLEETSESGTCFQILLPLAPDIEVDELEVPSTPRAPQSQRVLLIEDERIVRHTARRLMESLGYDVEEAGDGQEGVNRFRDRAGEFDVIVLDMVMPQLNGEDAFHQLRTIRDDIPIVLCSGYSLDESVARLRKQGLAGHLTKPFRRKELGDALRQALAN